MLARALPSGLAVPYNFSISPIVVSLSENTNAGTCFHAESPALKGLNIILLHSKSSLLYILRVLNVFSFSIFSTIYEECHYEISEADLRYVEHLGEQKLP